jgi:Leucine-rich repeat (LRR) protein
MYPETTEHVMYLNFNETAIKELPQSIGHLSRLVALNLRDCKQLGNLPESICLLKSIVIVDVSGCSNVTKFPSIPGNTRYLYLSGTAVEEFPSSVGHLWRFSSLDLSNCGRLKNLPSTIYELAYLEKLNLSGCSSITEFPNVSCNIKELYLDGTTIEEIPSSIGCFYKLVELHLRNCTKFEILPGSICKLKSLQKLNLSGCSRFQRFPGILETMESLRYLYLDRTGIQKLPSPIRNLKGLCCLELGNCIYLEGKYLGELRLLEQDVDLKYLRKLNLSG